MYLTILSTFALVDNDHFLMERKGNNLAEVLIGSASRNCYILIME
jgi:hypothetical protein